MGHILYNEVMRYNPKNPYWFNRDCFVLSTSHGCMLKYAPPRPHIPTVCFALHDPKNRTTTITPALLCLSIIFTEWHDCNYFHIFVLAIPHFSVIVSNDSFEISKHKERGIFGLLG
jgi:hypothetical protein